MEREHEQTQQTRGQLAGRKLSRRQVLWGGVALAVAPVLAACGDNLPTPTPAPAGGGGAATRPAPTTGPTAAAAATIVAGTPNVGASPALASTAVPPTPTAIAAIPRAKSSAKVTGKLQVVQHQDFHPDHNEFLRAEMIEYCKVNGWDHEISYAAGFQGGGDLLAALTASVQAGNPPDYFFQDIAVRQYQFSGVLAPMTDLTRELIGKYGEPPTGFEDTTFFDNEWWGTPFYTRGGGMYVRKDIFAHNGLDIDRDTETYDKLRETALKISTPDSRLWGWGMTVNRSGDGNSMVQNVLFRFGATVQDREGQRITFSSPEAVRALNWLKETYTDQKWAPMLPPGVNSWTDPSNNEAFLAGTIAITDNAGTMYAKAVYDKVAHAKDISFIQRPVRYSDNKRLDSLAGDRHHLIQGARNKDATYDLIRHLQSRPVQQQLWRTSPGYTMPAYKDGWSDPLIRENEVAQRSEPLAYPEGERFTGLRWPGPDHAAISAVNGGNYFTDMVAEVLQGKPAQEVVDEYHKRFVQIFKEFGRRGA